MRFGRQGIIQLAVLAVYFVTPMRPRPLFAQSTSPWIWLADSDNSQGSKVNNPSLGATYYRDISRWECLSKVQLVDQHSRK